MARKENVVSGLNAPGEPHEHQGVAHESKSHSLGHHVHRFVHVQNAGNHESPVCNRAPEMNGARPNWRVP